MLIEMLFAWVTTYPATPSEWVAISYPDISYNEQMLEKNFGPCYIGCIVTSNLGGFVDEFLAAAEAIKAEKRMVIIDGICASACAAFVDAIRPHACITSNAKFAFHLARRRTQFPIPPPILQWAGYPPESALSLTWDFTYPPQSPGVRQWVDTNGGFPVEGLLWMSGEEASQFWQVCGGPPAPRVRPQYPPTPRPRPSR